MYYLIVLQKKENSVPTVVRNERELLLQGTGIAEAVNKDLESINKEFNSVVLPFMRNHPDLFP